MEDILIKGSTRDGGSFRELRVLVPGERGGSISEMCEDGKPIEGAWIGIRDSGVRGGSDT